MVDLHGRTTPAMGIQVGRALEPRTVPGSSRSRASPGNVDAMAEVARALPIPIATGERLVTRGEFRELLDKRACAVIQPNVCYCGGVSEFRRIAALAETVAHLGGSAQPERTDRHDGERPPRARAAERPDPRAGPRRRAVASGDRGRAARDARTATSTRRRGPGSGSSSSRRSRRRTPADRRGRTSCSPPTAALLDW